VLDFPNSKKQKMSLAVCLSLLLAVVSPAPEIVGTLVGDNGKPVAGVAISVGLVSSSQEANNTVSRADGSFSFTDLAPGAYGVVAKTNSACAFSSAVSVHTGFTSVVHLRLEKGLCSSAFY
jgi:hypothetical protein